MKKRYLIIIVLFVGTSSFAQQLPQFTQYMYNTISINPAYAGSRDGFSLTALNRNQWVGVEGAPNTQTLSIHSPLRNDKIGLGLSVINDNAGYENYTYLYGDFSYRIDFDSDVSLAFGLKGGFSYYNLDEDLFAEPNVLDDPFFQDQFNNWTPNFGIGFYLSAQKWYIGLSAPKLINNNNHEYSEYLAMEQVHYFLTGGYVFDLSDNLKLRPTALAKVTKGAPLSVDVSSTFILNEKFYLGANYRIDDAIGGFLDVEILDGLRVGYGYEHTISDIRPYSDGSHEIILIYEFRFKNTRYKSPRFF
ncbi:PorP/SprF family type IX secretion system membrane protein [Salegentibacter chungangensis]|uniref:Type IX secretion system membrane protein PorP/SprF n=1 Tax=Salegentibacter chungangensis TaxID=1335724 RepID=A0ABW3NU94_9FLAO